MFKSVSERIIFLILTAVVVIVVSSQQIGDIEKSNPETPTQEQHECDDIETEGQCTHQIWKEGTVPEILEHLECEWNSKDVHQDDAWRTFNRVYNEVIGLERSTVPPMYGSKGFQSRWK